MLYCVFIAVFAGMLGSPTRLAAEEASLQTAPLSLISLSLPDLEASGWEYRRLLEGKNIVFDDGNDSTNRNLQKVLELGKRNLDWLNFMNRYRPEDDKIHLTKPGELTGNPIDSPKMYSDQTVVADLALLQKAMPNSMSLILFKGQDFTQDPPLPMEEYVKWARSTDRLYQTTARWLLLKPYLASLEARRQEDIRGYYFLGKIPDLPVKLQNFAKLPESEKLRLRDWLESMCINNFAIHAQCNQQVARAERDQRLLQFYDSLLPLAKQTWDRFFSLDVQRNDIRWTAKKPAVATIPFQTPTSERIFNFLKTNIEDEWRTIAWNLRLDFRKTNKDIPRVEFQAGVTPHVNALAGNIITMDENTPLEEWDVQWIIRHEFGHVLGFRDCYVEFYSPEKQVIINYQLDLTNLMCSRAGKLKATHFQEMKRVYFRN